jgi:hypothetical protein
MNLLNINLLLTGSTILPFALQDKLKPALRAGFVVFIQFRLNQDRHPELVSVSLGIQR